MYAQLIIQWLINLQANFSRFAVRAGDSFQTFFQIKRSFMVILFFHIYVISLLANLPISQVINRTCRDPKDDFPEKIKISIYKMYYLTLRFTVL